MSENKNFDTEPLRQNHTFRLVKWILVDPHKLVEYREVVKGKKDWVLEFSKVYSLFSLASIAVFMFFFVLFALHGFPKTLLGLEIQFDNNFIEKWGNLSGTSIKVLFLFEKTMLSILFALLVGYVISISNSDPEYFVLAINTGFLTGLFLAVLLIVLIITEGILIRIIAFTFLSSVSIAYLTSVSGGLVGSRKLARAGFIPILIQNLSLGVLLFNLLPDHRNISYFINYFIVLIIIYWFIAYRVLIWGISHVLDLKKVDFNNNVYFRSSVIWLPVRSTDKKLLELAKEEPLSAIGFMLYLLRNRPLQRSLVMKLSHAVSSTFIREALLRYELIEIPQLEGQPTLSPSDNWMEAYKGLDKALKIFRQKSSTRARLAAFIDISKAVKDLKDINLVSSPKWNRYYIKSIDELELEVERKLKQLRQEVAPIVSNPYQVGGSLDPRHHYVTFLGREDLKEKLTFIVRTSEEMPLFLVQGQRRVGKTSLLKFLPDLLGPGFKVVMIDLQEGTYSSVADWLNLVRHRANEVFGIEEEVEWQATEDWLYSWTELARYLGELAEQYKMRLILAFDEYEALHDRALVQDTQKAEQLLGAMRSYTQHQKKVILLFTGAHYFDELENPNWGTYFVHSQPLEVHYLSREKTLQLTHPTEDFPIKYNDQIPERIYELTQGHPALAQEICYYLVETANEQNRNTLTREDLERILEQRILVEHNHPMSRFWKDFCREEVMKETVRQIIRGETPNDKSSMRKLLRHQFVVKKEGGYQLCNPLFEQYIKRFDLEFLEL